jgi:hypothetical protein
MGAQAVQRHVGLLLFVTFSFKQRKSLSSPTERRFCRHSGAYRQPSAVPNRISSQKISNLYQLFSLPKRKSECPFDFFMKNIDKSTKGVYNTTVLLAVVQFVKNSYFSQIRRYFFIKNEKIVTLSFFYRLY